jgi:carbonic anhydrase/acetyltransferase-like protein (isoleucine patch superfamily)
MDGVKVDRNSIIAGHSILTGGTVIPENSIVVVQSDQEAQ